MSEEKEMVSMRDFYEILEIERTATAAEIKKAYRKKRSSTTRICTRETKRRSINLRK